MPNSTRSGSRSKPKARSRPTTPNEEERAEYRRIAERRVRLGLLLSEIGQVNGVAITQPEMNRLIGQEAAKYSQAEQPQVVKYFQENTMAAAQLRAPLYEDKVVDFLLSKAVVTERTVTREALQAEIESDDETPGGHVHGPDCDHDHGHDHAPAASASAKKTAAKKAPAKEAVAKEAPAKKAAAKKAAAVDAAPSAELAATESSAADVTAPARKPRAKKAAPAA